MGDEADAGFRGQEDEETCHQFVCRVGLPFVQRFGALPEVTRDCEFGREAEIVLGVSALLDELVGLGDCDQDCFLYCDLFVHLCHQLGLSLAHLVKILRFDPTFLTIDMKNIPQLQQRLLGAFCQLEGS